MSQQRRFGDRYALLEVLGEGPTSRVWAGRSVDGSWCAVKVFHDSGRRLDHVWFDRMTRVIHPHVVQVRDAVTEAGALGLVMDLVEGGDLRRTLLARGTIEPDLACRWGAQVAEGLAALHTAGVVHAGVRPENVLLDCETDAVRLVDAGVAAVHESPRHHGPSVATDLDDLGALLYELCCGVGPFRGHEPSRATTGAVWLPGRPDGMPEPLWHVISSLMDPERRPATAAEAAWELRALAPSMAGVPAAAPLSAAPHPTLRVLSSASVVDRGESHGTTGPASPGRRRVGRVRRRMVALAAVGAIVLGSAVGAGVASSHRDEAASADRSGGRAASPSPVDAPPTVEVRPAMSGARIDGR